MIATKRDVASIALAVLILGMDTPNTPTGAWSLLYYLFCYIVMVGCAIQVAYFVTVHLFLNGNAPKNPFTESADA